MEPCDHLTTKSILFTVHFASYSFFSVHWNFRDFCGFYDFTVFENHWKLSHFTKLWVRFLFIVFVYTGTQMRHFFRSIQTLCVFFKSVVLTLKNPPKNNFDILFFSMLHCWSAASVFINHIFHNGCESDASWVLLYRNRFPKIYAWL